MTELLSRLFVKNYKDPDDPTVRKSYGALSSFVGIFVNVILSIIKLVVGIITASAAIMADALNNFSDAGSSIITLVSFRLSSKPADKDHPFGHARIEYIASLIVSFLILLVGFETMFSNISVLLGLSEAAETSFSTASLIVIGASIMLKIWLSFFYKKIGKRIDSSVVKAAGVDSLMDSISTFAVLVSAIIVKLSGVQIIDTIMSMIVAVLIIVAGINILNETKNYLLGEAPIDDQIKAINSIIEEYPDIIDIHDLMIHNYGPNHYFATLHAEVDGNKDIFKLHDMIDGVEKRIQTDLNILCTIHLDPIVTDDETLNELKEFLLNAICEDVATDITVHDFRAVIGETHTNIIFDIMLPFESKLSPIEAIERISNAVLKRRDNVFCVITVDRG